MTHPNDQAGPMGETPKSPPKEAFLGQVEGISVYAIRDDEGRASVVSAIDEDHAKIGRLADRLQAEGYGVLRQRNPRAGRHYFRLRATWPGPGEPPDDPLAGA